MKACLAHARAYIYSAMMISVGALAFYTFASSAFGASTQVSDGLEDPQPRNRRQAIQSLVQQGEPSASKRFLDRLKVEPDASVRAALVDAVAVVSHGSATPEDLQPYLNDPDASVRAEAVTAIGQMGGAPAVDLLENTLLNDENAGVRMAAAFWLGGIRRPGSAAALGQALGQEQDANVRAQIARSLHWIGTGDAKTHLKKAQRDVDARVRRIANEK